MDARRHEAEATKLERRSERELIITRTIGGPARVVFDAWTRPELLRRWWAPRSRGVSLFECECDLRVGGPYRFVFGRDPQQPMVFSGRYLEVVPAERLVFTQIFEQARDAGEAVVTATFTEREGKTELVLHELFPSREALDGAISSGMEAGMRETFEQLAALVEG